MSRQEVDEPMSRIVIVNGSPRKNGNTSRMVSALVEEAGRKGHEVKVFEVGAMKLDGCRACGCCFGNGRACVSSDAFNDIADAIESSDSIVLAMPVYWYSIPGQIKNVIDRFFSFVVGKRDVSGKRFALISCCEEDDLTVFDGVKEPLIRTAKSLGWTYAGDVLVPGVLNEGDVDGTDGCDRVVELVNSL